MNHDNNGFADDSRTGERKDQALQNPISREDAEELPAAEACDLLDGEGTDQELPEELEAILAQPNSRELLAEIHMLEEYHGLLPKPDHFNAYPPEAQKMLLEIASREIKAVYDDESKRQDKLTDAEIEQGSRGQFLSVIVIVSALAAAMIIAIFSGSATAVIAVMSIPFVAVIGNLISPLRSRNKRDVSDKKAQESRPSKK